MKNSIWEDFLIFATGGILGMLAGTALISNDEKSSEEEDATGTGNPDVDELMAAFQKETEDALASCKTEEERKAVYEDIHQSIQALQASLVKRRAQEENDDSEERGERHFVDAEKETLPKPDETFANEHVQNVQRLIAQMDSALKQTVENMYPVTSRPSAPSSSCDS